MFVVMASTCRLAHRRQGIKRCSGDGAKRVNSSVNRARGNWRTPDYTDLPSSLVWTGTRCQGHGVGAGRRIEASKALKFKNFVRPSCDKLTTTLPGPNSCLSLPPWNARLTTLSVSENCPLRSPNSDILMVEVFTTPRSTLIRRWL